MTTAGQPAVLNAEARRIKWAAWAIAAADARAKISAWRDEYNGERPHSSLGYRTPNEFAEVLKSSAKTG